jgi:hypothetical protein
MAKHGSWVNHPDPKIRAVQAIHALEKERLELDKAVLLEMATLRQGLLEQHHAGVPSLIDGTFFRNEEPANLRALRLSPDSVTRDLRDSLRVPYYPYNLHSSYSTEFEFLKKVFQRTFPDAERHAGIVGLMGHIFKEFSGPLGKDPSAHATLAFAKALAARYVTYELATPQNKLPHYTAEQKRSVIALSMIRAFHNMIQERENLEKQLKVMVSEMKPNIRPNNEDPWVDQEAWKKVKRARDVREIVPSAIRMVPVGTNPFGMANPPKVSPAKPAQKPKK